MNRKPVKLFMAAVMVVALGGCDLFGSGGSSGGKSGKGSGTPPPPATGAPTLVTPFANVTLAQNTSRAVLDATAHFSAPSGVTLAYHTEGFISISVTMINTFMYITSPPNYAGTEAGAMVACDPAGQCARGTFSVTYLGDTTPTVVTAFTPVTMLPGATVSVGNVGSHFIDSDGDALNYSVGGFTNIVAQMNVNSILLTAPVAWTGTETGSVMACDPAAHCVATPLQVTVSTSAPTNHPPTVASVFTPVTGTPGTPVAVSARGHFTDIDGDPLTYSASGFTNITATVTGGTVTVSSAATWSGTETGAVRACDPSAACVSTPLAVTFTKVNHAPTVVSTFAAVSLYQGTTTSVAGVAAHFTDADGDVLTYSVTGFTNVTAAIAAGRVNLTAPAAWSGTETGSVKACDPSAACVSTPLAVTVSVKPATNHAPVVAGTFAAVSGPQGTIITVVAKGHFTDPDSDPLTYKTAGFTNVASIVAGGTITLSAASTWSGTETGSVSACDPGALCVSTPLAVTFTHVNHAPTVASGFAAVTLVQGATTSVKSVNTHFADADGDVLTYSVTGFTNVTAALSGTQINLTAPAAWTGTETGSVKACDPAPACVTTPLAVTVNAKPASNYVVLAQSDMGLHVMMNSYSELMIEPPGNDLQAMVIDRSGPLPMIVQSGLTVSYSFVNNTSSATKTNFWTYAAKLLGTAPALNVGKTGNGMTGTLKPTAGKDFFADWIPLTPTLDSGTVNPFQIANIVVKSGGVVKGQTQTVAAVTTEYNCANCHGSGATTWQADVLAKHDAAFGTNFSTTKPVACGRCHQQGPNGAWMPGMGGYPPYARALHNSHANRVGSLGCYACHSQTSVDSERGVHKTMGVTCTTCHGTMSALAAGTRKPWIDLPTCGTCHSVAGHTYEQAGVLFKDAVGHNGVKCYACHGAPHALGPSTIAQDNAQAIALQGVAGPIGTAGNCSVCHSSTPPGAFRHTYP